MNADFFLSPLFYTEKQKSNEVILCCCRNPLLPCWKIWKQYQHQLQPNRKFGQELIDYLSENYVLTEIHDLKAAEVVTWNVTMNTPIAAKLPDGMLPQPKTYYVGHQERGQLLYLHRAAIFQEVENIFVGIDLQSGYYLVEGSDLPWDELCAVQG